MISVQSRRQQLVLIMLLGIAFIGAGIGLRDPWPSDEPRFALIAQEMVDEGEWFFPRRGGELYPDKPPLFMWSQALFYKLTGSLRIAFLFPSLLAGLATLLIVYDAGQRFFGRRQVGLMAALLLLATPQFVLESRAGQLDAMVTAWIALGLYGFLRHLLQGPDLRWLYVGFAACGLGIITKGVGFLPLLVFLPWLWARSRAPVTMNRSAGLWPHGLTGPAVMLLVVAAWLVPMLLQVEMANDPAYLQYRDNILFKQTGERYLTPIHHFKPAWFFLAEVIPSLWLPLFLLFPWLIPAWKRRIWRHDSRFTLLLGWSALVVLFFSLSPAKRGVYILPALPWVCLAAAPLLSALVKRLGVRRITLAATGLFTSTLLAGGIYLLWIRPEKNLELIERYEIDIAPGLLICGLIVGLLSVLLRARPALSYLSVMGALWMAHGLWLGPAANNFKSGSSLMLRVENMMPSDAPLALVDWKEQTLLQARRPTENFGFLVPVEEQSRLGIAWLARNPGGRLLVQGQSMTPCFVAESSEYVGLAHRRDWYLVGPSGVADTCARSSPH